MSVLASLRQTLPRSLLRQPLRIPAFPLSILPQCRYSSHSPFSPSAVPPRKKVTINTIRKLYADKTPLAMITAHDFPSGLAADMAGVDMVLIGDSLAMVALGMEDTNGVSLEAMVHHSRAVTRAVRSAFIIADIPMGSYEVSPEQALTSALALVRKGRVHAVKVEGGAEIAPTIAKLTKMGIPVMGHIGLTPQRQNALGGFRVQAKTAPGAERLLDDAKAVADAGAFAMVVEAVPEEIAGIVTEKISVPTIGIGAGKLCSGQVLVQCDMLGNFPEGRFLPRFVKRYGNIFEESVKAMKAYKEEVRSRAYPSEEFTYPVAKEAVEEFRKIVEERSEEFRKA